MLSWTQNLVPFIHVCLRNSVFVEPLSLFLSVQLSSAPSRPSALPQHRPANGYDKPRAAAGDFSYNIYINVYFFFLCTPQSAKEMRFVFACVQVQEQEVKTPSTPASPFINRRPQVKTKRKLQSTSSLFLLVPSSFSIKWSQR